MAIINNITRIVMDANIQLYVIIVFIFIFEQRSV